jgi:hypothetical protein
LKDLLRELKASVWENDHERGILGWKLPGIITRDGLIKALTLDVFAKLKSGAMVAIEVDYQYKGSPIAKAKMDYRDSLLLMQFGITTVRLTPKAVDGMTAQQLEEELNYWLVGEGRDFLAISRRVAA